MHIRPINGDIPTHKEKRKGVRQKKEET